MIKYHDLSKEAARFEDTVATLACRLDALSVQQTKPATSTLGAYVQDSGLPEPSFAYQAAYPDLYVAKPPESQPPDKTIYLTFDDGPSGNTGALLDILDYYNVKATFFVVGSQIENRSELIKRAYDSGHTIGIHTDSHQYRNIYASVEAYLADFAAASAKVEAITGEKPSIFRFPGGSINSYNDRIYQQLIAEMLRRGYTYYDWNVSAQDAINPGKSQQEMVDIVMHDVAQHQYSVVLLHDADSRETSVFAVNQLIPLLSEKGYRFAPLDNTVPSVIFTY